MAYLIRIGVLVGGSLLATAEDPCRAPESSRSTTDPVQTTLKSAGDSHLQFFIVLKGGRVYTSISYWLQDGTLHYVTAKGHHNQVSLDLVDRQLSEKLNEGSRPEFLLPSP